MAEGEIFFKDARDLMAYYELDLAMRQALTSADHMNKLGMIEMSAFFTMQASSYGSCLQTLVAKQSGIIPVRLVPPPPR